MNTNSLVIVVMLIILSLGSEVACQKLIGAIFLINNGAEMQANVDEYKYFRNPSLNRDISKTGKMQQKYLALFLKSDYSNIFAGIDPTKVQIFTNQKLKCIRSAIVVLTTLFSEFSYYFDEETKSSLPDSYRNQKEVLSGLKELKINYENRKINRFYKNCKDSILRENAVHLPKILINDLMMTDNEFTQLALESHFVIETVLDIYDLIILNRTFRDIVLHPKTETMMKKLLVNQDYLISYSGHLKNDKADIISKIHKFLASEVLYKIISFIDDLIACIKQNPSNECSSLMFNFYDRSDFVEIFSIMLDKSKINEDLDKVVEDESLFSFLYPPYSSLLVLELYQVDDELALAIKFNNENVIEKFADYLYVKPSQAKDLGFKYYDYKTFRKQIIKRVSKINYESIRKAQQECKNIKPNRSSHHNG